MKAGKWIILGLVIAMLLGLYFWIKNLDQQCEEECKEKGAIFSIRTANGEYDNKDHCTCFYQDRTETHIMNAG